jgi:hypothetical protein
MFQDLGNITRAHKNSTEWNLAERKLHIKNAKNYRGITVTPTLSKIIEKILKIRENGKIPTSSAQVRAQTLIFPIFPPNPESSRKFRRELIYSLYRLALSKDLHILLCWMQNQHSML